MVRTSALHAEGRGFKSSSAHLYKNMIIFEKSNRITNIETNFNASIKDLLYQMHWPENMKHNQIGNVLDIPRITITRWFNQFGVPTQSCRRFTDKNLTSWLYKTGKLQKKIRYESPDRRIQRSKGGVDVDFFKKWSSRMAYILGYFCADGCMFINSGGSKFISFVSTDRELLEKLRRILKSRHKIAPKRQSRPNCKPTFWLQIGSKEIYDDMLKLGLLPRKELRLKLPKVPPKHFRHFLRGYFDGDGCVSYGYYERKNRKSRIFLLTVRFASASKSFLNSIKQQLAQLIDFKRGCISKGDSCYYLAYSKGDSKRLFEYMYDKIDSDFYLERKYNKFLKAFHNIGAVA